MDARSRVGIDCYKQSIPFLFRIIKMKLCKCGKEIKFANEIKCEDCFVESYRDKRGEWTARDVARGARRDTQKGSRKPKKADSDN